MNWRKLNNFVQYVLSTPTCFLIFASCAGATVGILYLQISLDIGLQYMPAIASAIYIICRCLFIVHNGLFISRNEILGYIFILSTAFAVAMQIHLQLDVADRNGRSSLDYTVAMWVFNVFYFFAGAACTRAAYRKSDILAVVLTLMVLIPFLEAPKQVIFLDYYAMRVATGMDGLSHLFLSEWCVFFFIGAFAFSTDRLRPLIILIAGLCLFGLQGRSSTFFTLFTLLSFWVLTGGKKIVFICVGIVAVAVVAVTVFPVENLLSDANQSSLDRMLISEGDGSLEARKDLFWTSLKHLPQSIPYGDPTYIAYEAGSMGSYIHNILSMWQFFGLLPFILLIVVLIRGLMEMKKRLSLGRLTVMEEIACMLLIYSSVSVIFSKSIVFYWVWFAAGYWMLKYTGPGHAVVQRKKKRRRRTKRRRSRRSSAHAASTN